MGSRPENVSLEWSGVACYGWMVVDRCPPQGEADPTAYLRDLMMVIV